MAIIPNNKQIPLQITFANPLGNQGNPPLITTLKELSHNPGTDAIFIVRNSDTDEFHAVKVSWNGGNITLTQIRAANPRIPGTPVRLQIFSDLCRAESEFKDTADIDFVWFDAATINSLANYQHTDNQGQVHRSNGIVFERCVIKVTNSSTIRTPIPKYQSLRATTDPDFSVPPYMNATADTLSYIIVEPCPPFWPPDTVIDIEKKGKVSSATEGKIVRALIETDFLGAEQKQRLGTILKNFGM